MERCTVEHLYCGQLAHNRGGCTVEGSTKYTLGWPYRVLASQTKGYEHTALIPRPESMTALILPPPKSPTWGILNNVESFCIENQVRLQVDLVSSLWYFIG